MSNITEPAVLISTIAVIAMTIGAVYAYYAVKDKLG
jgi:hypothetical protein